MKKLILIILSFCIAISSAGCREEYEVNENYDLTINLSSDMELQCAMNYSFICRIEEQTHIKFNLFANAFSEEATISPVYDSDVLIAYPNGKSYTNLEITTVKTNGETCDFQTGGVNDGILTVGFNRSLQKGKEYEIYIEYSLKLANVKHRLGYGDNTVNLTGFYPIACVYENGDFYQNVYYPTGDPFYSECADYSVKLTLPSTLVVASSMSPLKTKWNVDTTTYYFAQKNVREIGFVLSEKFNVLENTFDGVSVKYYYFSDENPEKSLQTACDALQYFSDAYCKYPYENYAVCQADFIYGGMEYPCLAMISSDVASSYRDYVIAHETAHQWFYGLLGFNQSEEAFLDEGLTELSTAMFLDGKNGLSYKDYLNQAKSSYLAIDESLTYLGYTYPKVMLRNLKEFKSQAEYVMIAYNLGELAFDSVRESMGDKNFKKFLKGLFEKYKYQNVNYETFKAELNKKSKNSCEILAKFVSGNMKIN